ncbi:MAG: hypothetical protein KAT09_05470 [Candidatus Aegiribacteria sp.]|nr:hypothetical protein [Candidatus Aegiribacteria sp.]
MVAVVNKEVRKIFENLGFSENEGKAYYVLLQKEACSPAEVGRMASLNMKKVYDILVSLEKKGGCVQLNTGRKQYKAVNPEILFKKAQNILAIETELLNESINKVSKDLILLYENAIEQDVKLDYITVMKDPVQIAEKISELSLKVRNEILNFSLNPMLLRNLNEIDKKLAEDLSKKSPGATLEALKQRGVVVYSITGLEQLSEDLVLETIKRCTDFDNVDLRIVDRVPCKAKIYDCCDILLGMKSRTLNKYTPLTFHIKDEGLAELLRDSFYQRFNNAPSVKDLDVDILLKEKRIVRLK